MPERKPPADDPVRTLALLWGPHDRPGRSGLTVRAIVLLRDWIVREISLTTLDILPHRDNMPSRVVAERAGFPWTGELATIRRMPPGRQQGYRVHRWRSGPPPATSPPPGAPT